jgi:predicted kinase
VLYDLAFLLMDLWHRNQPDFANLVFNRYLDGADETDGLGLVPFFMAVRAAVRAHVTAVQAREAQEDGAEKLHKEALAYFELAERLMAPVAPMLVAVGGLSGSGKSTAAASIASAVGAAPGARVLSSDRIRKALHAVAPESRLPDRAYWPEISEHVYARMRDEARAALVAGCAVVADAVFDRPADREAIRRVAHETAVPFEGFWLSAPLDVLLGRLAERKGDPSDATAAVLLAQAARHCGDLSWRPIDAATELAHIRKTMLANLKGPGAR